MRSSSSLDESIVESSRSFFSHSQQHLISKILELETRLYQVSIDNQELRHTNITLQTDFAQKKGALAHAQPPQPPSLQKNRKNYSQCHSRRGSGSVTGTPQVVSQAVASVQPRACRPFTGLEINFSSLKEVDNEVSTSESNISKLSSARSTGIRKNVRSPRPGPEVVEMGFRSID